MAGLSTPIYKIDLDAAEMILRREVPVADLPAFIVEHHNVLKGEEAFVPAGNGIVDGCRVFVYRNQMVRATPSPWVRFYEHTQGVDLGQLYNETQQLIAFVVIGSDLFAHTAGQSVSVFERFVDIAFPIEVGRRIAKPEVKGARSSQITGGTLANVAHFRDPRRLTRIESLENVWTALTGQLRDDVLREPAVESIFGVKKRLRLEVTTGIKAGPKVRTPDQLVNFMRWLNDKAQAPLPEDDAWGILDSIKVLSVRKRKDLINQLREQLAVQIFGDRDFGNFAIMNSDPTAYDNAMTYSVQQGKDVLYAESTRPDLRDFIDAVSVDPESVVGCLRAVTITSENADLGLGARTHGSLMDHLNGELRRDGKTYFLLTGNWYEVEATYIEAVTDDFVGLMGELDISAADVGLREWTAGEHEGSYNESSLTAGTFINGDRILTDNIELFDGLAATSDCLYIVHVKDGFDVKVRDVRSQIINSAQVIENDLRTGTSPSLKRHHAALVHNRRTQLSQADFIRLFELPRVYVLAYGTKLKVERNTLPQFRSSVARIETVALRSQFRQISTSDSTAQLRIAWVKVVDGPGGE